MASGKVAKRPQPAGRASYHSPPAERIDGRGSPTESTSGSSSTGDEGLTFKCFFKHRDPHHAAKLHSRYKSCNSQFPNVNRLREHIVRAHSLSHNCRGCRHRTTKAKEAPEFQARHAHCSTTSPIQKPLTGVKPVLLDQVQTDALTNLNLHHKKPHDERSRCKKLWDALFPLEQFDPAVMTQSGSENRQEANRGNQRAVLDSAPSPTTRGSTPSSRSSSEHSGRNQVLPTPSASPRARVESDFSASARDDKPLFSQVPSPKDGNYTTKQGETSIGDSAIYLEDDSLNGDAGQKDVSLSRTQGQSRRASLRMSSPDYSPETPPSQTTDIEFRAVAWDMPSAGELAKHQPRRIHLGEDDDEDGEAEDDDDDDEEENDEGDEQSEDDDDESMHGTSCASRYHDDSAFEDDSDGEEMGEAHHFRDHDRNRWAYEKGLIGQVMQCCNDDETDDIIYGRDGSEDAMSIDSRDSMDTAE